MYRYEGSTYSSAEFTVYTITQHWKKVRQSVCYVFHHTALLMPSQGDACCSPCGRPATTLLYKATFITYSHFFPYVSCIWMFLPSVLLMYIPRDTHIQTMSYINYESPETRPITLILSWKRNIYHYISLWHDSTSKYLLVLLIFTTMMLLSTIEN